MNEARVRAVVFGIVQRVGFRYAAYDAAHEFGVAGWVRNLPDGTVEIVAQGQPAAVARLVAWAERGPRRAVVERVVVEQETPESGLTGFGIRV